MGSGSIKASHLEQATPKEERRAGSDRLRHASLSNFMSPCFKIKCRNTGSWECSSVVERLLHMHKAQGEVSEAHPSPRRSAASACPSLTDF